MAIELQVTAVVALVTSEPKERKTYEGRDENRKETGRLTDGQGRPLSAVSAVLLAEPLGLLPDAQLQLPDLQMTGLRPGAVVQVEGQLTVRLAGGDYASIRTTVTGERLAPLGQWAEWIGQHRPTSKPADSRAA